MAIHPNCLQDGTFLVDIYILHPKDYWFSAQNQHFWLEYHRAGSSSFAAWKFSYHLIKPTHKSRLYPDSKGSVPYWQWPYLFHNDRFVHGTFEFTVTKKGQQSRDLVSVEDWTVLHNHHKLYFNDPPSMKMVVQLSIHCTPLSHTQIVSRKVDE